MQARVNAEILMNVGPRETRVALVENGKLQEVLVERHNKRGLVSNIYKGKVVRVLPGMQAAFVDIGLERAGFLHVGEVMPLRNDSHENPTDFNSPEADIRKWLKEGQEILVQVMKDPLGSKGARLSTHLSIASRYLVRMPNLQHIGVSLRLEDEAERERLQEVMGSLLDQDAPQGYIVRTVAEGLKTEDLQDDLTFLDKLWSSVESQAKSASACSLVYEDLPLMKRTLRDMVNDSVEKVRVDCEKAHETLHDFIDDFIPNIKHKIEHYRGDGSIFDMHGVEDELKRALERRVDLKSGGYLVIDQTEAMTTIDVNTGGFVGSVNLEETIFKTNLEAAKAIGRQLRLRNLGGIIILDFIDMQEEEHKEQLMQALEKVLASDYARTNVSPISDLGLVEMTRKRTTESLAKQLCEVCPVCEGRGRIKTVETMGYEILREVNREAQAYDAAEGFLVLAAEPVVDWLLNEESHALADLEASIERPIRLQVEHNCHQEQYEIVLM